MINHITLVTFKSSCSQSDKVFAAVKLKEGLENFAHKIQGLESIKVENILMDTSSADMLIQCKFTEKSAIERYLNSPFMFNINNITENYIERMDTADYISYD